MSRLPPQRMDCTQGIDVWMVRRMWDLRAWQMADILRITPAELGTIEKREAHPLDPAIAVRLQAYHDARMAPRLGRERLRKEIQQ